MRKREETSSDGRHFKEDGNGIPRAHESVPPFLAHMADDANTPAGGDGDGEHATQPYRHITVIDSRIAIRDTPAMLAERAIGSATLDIIKESKAAAVASIDACGEELRRLSEGFRQTMRETSVRYGMPGMSRRLHS